MDNAEYYRAREASERLAAENSINAESRAAHLSMANIYASMARVALRETEDGPHIRSER